MLETSAAPAEAPPRLRWPVPALAALAGLVLLAAGFLIWGLLRHPTAAGPIGTCAPSNNSGVAECTAPFENLLAAARHATLDLNSFDYRHVNQDFAAVQSDITGPLAADFVKDQSALRKALASQRLVSVATIDDAAVADLSGGQAAVLVATDVEYSTGGHVQPQVHRYRLELKMVLLHGRWLASNIEPVG